MKELTLEPHSGQEEELCQHPEILLCPIMISTPSLTFWGFQKVMTSHHFLIYPCNFFHPNASPNTVIQYYPYKTLQMWSAWVVQSVKRLCSA